MKKLLFILAYIPFVGMAQVGIGTSSPQAKLHIQGDLRVGSLKNIAIKRGRSLLKYECFYLPRELRP